MHGVRRDRCWVFVAGCLTALLVLPGCGSSDREYVTLGTAPIGGAFRPVGEAIAASLNSNPENAWRAQPKGTKGSQQNIRELDSGRIQLAMSNSAISYYAVRGEGAFEKPFPVRAVVTLAPNVGLFITKQATGIRAMADLKGKRVVVGPGGAGFEMFLGPLMTEHGVAYPAEPQTFTAINDNYANAVTLLGDGTADAAFMGGAIPTPAVVQACTTEDIFFIPYDESVRVKLIEDYPFYRDITVPAKTPEGKPVYADLDTDFPALDVGSMHLITSAGLDDEMIYGVTKTIWENRDAIAAQHPAGKAINEKNAARFTGTPFHPGAARFYREIGIWQEENDALEAEILGDKAGGQL